MSISYFNLQPGRIIAKKYEVVSLLGAGWEGEVYKLLELDTNIECAAKIFYPERNQRDRAVKFYAKKLHMLRSCPIVIQYHTKETFTFNKTLTTLLISEFVEGDLLSELIGQLPGKRMLAFEGIHLLYALTRGIEQIHGLNEYHGDLHSGNVIINKYGLEFELKLMDLYLQTDSKRECQKDDIVGLIHILYEALGGKKFYANQPEAIKYICCGLKRSLILNKFKNAAQLRLHLENMSW
jgi:serine/threonine protein kinase